jgi:hypothetical protein
MRFRSAPFKALLLVSAALALAGCEAEPDEAYESTPWVVISVSEDQRVLTLTYESGGCAHGARAETTESATSVSITVQQLQPTDGRVCAAILGFPRLRVQLRQPLAGRMLHGQARHLASSPRHNYRHGGARLIPLVPRLAGLNAGDALSSLRIQQVRVRRPYPPAAATVIGAAPGPGEVVPRAGLRLVTDSRR